MCFFIKKPNLLKNRKKYFGVLIPKIWQIFCVSVDNFFKYKPFYFWRVLDKWADSVKLLEKFSIHVCIKEGIKLNQLFFMNCCRNCSFFFMSNFWYILTQSKVPRVFFLHSFIVICCIRLRNRLYFYREGGEI